MANLIRNLNVDFYKLNTSKNKHTSKATSTCLRTYIRWAANNNKTVEIHTIESPVELNRVLECFFASIKKLDGTEYEPVSLCALEAAIDRHLKEMGSPHQIFKDLAFSGSRNVLEGRGKYLRNELGMGKHPNKASSMTRQEEEILWDSAQLGSSDGRTLVHTMWWLMTMHFGMRSREEHYAMKIEDLVIRKGDNNMEYITFSENATKTRQGGLRKKERLITPKMFATGLSRCPVSLFREYVRRRPESIREYGPFYLAIIERPATEVWYKVSRLGINYISGIMKKMTNDNVQLSESEKRFTNHTARKTLIKKLKSNQVPKSEIIRITGHSRESGLDPYDSGDESEQQLYSNIIDNVEATAPVVHVPNPTARAHSSSDIAGPSSATPDVTSIKHPVKKSFGSFFSDEV